MAVKVFGLDICPLDLITGDNGRLSGNKIWMNVCYGILSYKMMNSELTWDLMTAYGSIVGGSYIAAKLITMKYANPPGDATINQPEKVNITGDVKIKGKKK